MPAPATAAVSRAAPDFATAPRFRVFLSYSHADTKWARWLMRRLEGYSVPKRFRGRRAPIGEVGRRIAPVFRDRDELPTTSDLGETIRGALRESATLVVICSPSAARSRWVQEEIITFKRLHGERSVFAFIVSGEPKHEGAADDCFSPALRAGLDADGQLSNRPAEVVAADARPGADGPKFAFMRLVAGLLGVGFDELRQRELQRRNRRLMVVSTCSMAGMALMLGLAVTAWRARNDAQRRQDQAEDVLAFMLGDFRDELNKLGQLPLLDRVGKKASNYFDSLDPRDLTDTALARQAKALIQIGEVRVDQARYPDAMRSFQAAYARARELAARHPKNGEMLFERAQAEYWVGIVLRRRGDLQAMTKWLVRYRDTAAALVALDPAEPRWQEELASGYHNLAVVDLDAGRLTEARQGFLGKLAMLARRSEAKRADLTLQFRMADANSWLGNIAERTGDFGEALVRCGQYVASMEELVRAEPANTNWQLKLADALALQAHLLAITGERKAAMERRARATDLFEALVAGDPTNQTRLKRALTNRLKEASLLMAEGADSARCRQVVRDTKVALEKLAGAQPNDREVVHGLAVAWRGWAQLLAAAGEPGADAAAARAIELGESLATTGRATEEMIGEAAKTRVTAALLAARAGDRNAMQTHARRALELLGSRTEQSNHWRVLDPAARAFALLGDFDRHRAIVARLERMNYHPLEPWPGETAVREFVRNQ